MVKSTAIDITDFKTILRNYNFTDVQCTSLAKHLENWNSFKYIPTSKLLPKLEATNDFSLLAIMKLTFIKYKMIIESWSIEDVKNFNFENSMLEFLDDLDY